MDSDSEFIAFEKKQLEDIQKSFTPNQQKQYGEEIDYINYLLDLLAKQEKKPQTEKQKDNEDQTKGKIQKSLSQLVNNFTLAKATQITHTELTEGEMLDAKLTKASNKYYRVNGLDSDNYLAQEGIPDWKIDADLSNDKGIVAHNEKTGEAKLAFRGTDRNNLGDLDVDARIYLGTENNHPHFTEARKQAREMINKYGKENSSVAGYSLGGNKSWVIGNEFDIPSTGFNSYIGKNIVNRPDVNMGQSKHTIIRTQDDLPSIQATYLEGKGNTEVKTVETRGGNMKALNPFKAHADTNFISNEGRSGNINNKGALDPKIEELVQHGLKHGELRTLDQMTRQNKRKLSQKLREQGKFKEYPPEERNTTYADTPENRLMYQERQEAKQRTRQQAELDSYETRGDDFTGGLEPDDTPLINRNDPRYRQQNRPTYQNNLERNATALPDFHLPKTGRGGKPRTDLEIAQETTRLERQRGLGGDTSRGGYKSKPARDTLGDLIREAESNVNGSQPFRPDPTSTTPELDAELNNTMEFARGLSPPRTRQTKPTRFSKIRGEIKGLRSKTNPPLERQNNKSRALQQQTERLEDGIRIENPQPTTTTTTTPETGNQTFSSWSNENDIEPTNHKKTLWEKSGGQLTPEEREGYTPETFGENVDLNNFVSMSNDERTQQLDEHSTHQSNLEEGVNALDRSNIRVGAGGQSYGMEIARGIHPSNLILGYLTGQGADAIEAKINQYIPNQPEPLQTAETGVIAGGLTSSLLGTAFLPEAVAGGAGYLTQEYATKGIYAGLKAVGASENTSVGVAETGGGVVGGGVAGYLGALTAGATLGAEDGAIAGMGFGSAELGLIGGAVGGLIGLGSYAWSRRKG